MQSKKSGDDLGKVRKGGGDNGSGSAGAALGTPADGVIVGDMRDGLNDGVNQSSGGGCKCVIM